MDIFNIKNKFKIFSAALLLCFSMVFMASIISVYAPDPDFDDETVITETQYEEPETDPPEQETEPETQPPVQETEAYNDPDETEPVQNQTEETEQSTESDESGAGGNEPDPTDYLPELDEQFEVKPDIIGADAGEAQIDFIGGTISWLCVAFGVAAIVGVLLSNKRRGTAYSSESSRYGSSRTSRKRRSKKKRLLSDSYYTKNKRL